MVYVKQEWVDHDPNAPLSAARLNYIETGIAEVADSIPESWTPIVAAAVAADETVVAAAAAAVETATAELDLLDTQQVQGAAAWNPEGAYPKGSVVAHGGSLWQARPGAEVTTVRTNHVPDPLFLGSNTWTITGGSITSVVDGVATITCTTTRAAGNTVVGLGTPTVAAGTGPWAVSLRVGVPLDGVAVTLLVSAGFGPSPLSSPATTSVSLTPGEEVTVTQAGNTVGATGKTTVAVRIQAGTGGFPAGAKLTMSQPILEQGATVGPFFHGDTPDIDTPELSATYVWLGTPNASASQETRVSYTAGGAPGTSPDWLRLWSLPDVRPVPALAASRVTASLADIPRWMDRTRTKVWGRSGGALRESVDDGVTWTTVNTWTGATLGGAVREFEDGELLVVVTPTATDAPSEVWVSSGYPTLGAGATWTKRIQPTTPGIRFTDAWSVYVHGSIGLVAEYGPKEGSAGVVVGSGQFARLVHLTLDNGKTWTQILDLATLAGGTDVGLHLHGVAWDPYWDRIWVTWGDDQNGTSFSDDLGATWHNAHYDSSVNGPYQNVGILPMKDVVLFGSDIAPNGIYSIDRAQGKHSGAYTIELAHAINAETQRNALCQGIFQASPDHPAFFAFGSETRPMASQIVATRDGRTFYKVWEDEAVQPAGRGLRSVIGPTLRGRLFAEFYDEDDGGTSIVTGPAPY